MESETKIECSRILEIIDRLVRCEEITDEETAQVIHHTSSCTSCKTYIDEVLNITLKPDDQS